MVIDHIEEPTEDGAAGSRESTSARAATVQSPSEPELQQVSARYVTWLNEDVVYVISPMERQAFLQLPTDAEREAFIAAFWQRRNPTPNSTDNPAKEEHYRRIAYANAKFGSPTRAGWKTDRGRIYIQYGAPDQIETHAKGEIWKRPSFLGGGETRTYAYEDWRYQHLDVIGDNVVMEFVDRMGNGDPLFTNDPLEKELPSALSGKQLVLPPVKVAQPAKFEVASVKPCLSGDLVLGAEREAEIHHRSGLREG